MTFVSIYESTFTVVILVTAVLWWAVRGPLVIVIFIWPEHNIPLAGCFYIKCLTGSCVHTFLTCAVGIAHNPHSVRTMLCPQIYTVQFFLLSNALKASIFVYEQSFFFFFFEFCCWFIYSYSIFFVFFQNFTRRKDKMNQKKHKTWFRTRQQNLTTSNYQYQSSYIT